MGKSSLLNALLKKERAIVTDLPGTTRDMIEESLIIGQVPVLLVDTAGLRPPKDLVEEIGIEKTRQRAADADLVVLMVDASRPLETADLAAFTAVKKQRPVIVYNKIDLCKESMAIEAPLEWQALDNVKISAKYLHGLERLEAVLSGRLTGTAALEPAAASPAPNFRQKNAILEALASARALARGMSDVMPLELVAIEARQARQGLQRVIGVDIDEALLDEIFGQFCIGK